MTNIAASSRPSSDSTKLSLTKSWQELCETALKNYELKSKNSEQEFLTLLQSINSDLGFKQLVIPKQASTSEQLRLEHNKNVDTFRELKDATKDNKSLIENLLAQKDAAETEVSIKADELRKLQRYLNESEVCIKLIEDELEELRDELRLSQKSGADAEDMKELIQNFARESSELLTCIATLEQENIDLHKRLDGEG